MPSPLVLVALFLFATVPLLALGMELVRLSGFRVKYFSRWVLALCLLLAVAGLAKHWLDYLEAGLIVMWFFDASSLVGPLWRLRGDKGRVEFRFPWNWKRLAVAVVFILLGLMPVMLLKLSFDGSPLKSVLLGAILSFPTYRELMGIVVELRTTGVRVGIRLYPWHMLGKFTWDRPPSLGTEALRIEAPFDVNKDVRIRSAVDPRVDFILRSHGLVEG